MQRRKGHHAVRIPARGVHHEFGDAVHLVGRGGHRVGREARHRHRLLSDPLGEDMDVYVEYLHVMLFLQ